jgi:hypothetical protein
MRFDYLKLDAVDILGHESEDKEYMRANGVQLCNQRREGDK